MTTVNGQLVRDYLESLGFLTRQPRKYQVIARGKNPDEEADWLAWNPGWKPGTDRPAPGIWGARELGRVKALSVAVKGWHTDRFTPAMVSGTPELWRFAGGEAMGAASAALGAEKPAPVLFLADLPPGREERAAAVEALTSRGVEGIVPFRTMLFDLLDWVDTKRNYVKSDALQMLRILKAYRMTRPRQMEFEVGEGRARRGRGGAKRPEGDGAGAGAAAEIRALWEEEEGAGEG
jgi:hypothetical protein